MRSAAVLFVIAATATPVWGAAAAPPVTDCDRLAAHPQDVRKAADGVDFDSIDPERAIAACSDALDNFPNEPRFAFQLARALDRGGQILRAMEMYRRLADAGYVQAQVTMGLSYIDGTAVETDPSAAAAWFQRAQQSGHPQAEFYLGLMYARGLGVTPDKKAALRLLQQAVDTGYDRALVALADLLSSEYRPCDALPIYQKASEKGFVAGTIAHAAMLARGQCVAKDVERAKQMLKPIAESGDPEAQFTYANVLFLAALESNGSAAEGMLWLRRAAEQDDVQAEEFLYRIYSGQFSQPKSPFDAFIWAFLYARHNPLTQPTFESFAHQLSAGELARARTEIERLVRNFPAARRRGLPDRHEI